MMLFGKNKFWPGIVLLMLLPFTCSAAPVKQKPKSVDLTLAEFIQRAASNDLTFEAILIDQLPLPYRRILLLPDDDIMMKIKYQHHFYLNQNTDSTQASIGLSKLFPYQGTEVSLTYNKFAARDPANEDSSLELLLSQPIARNAFGKSTKLQDQIIGLENDISRYQIVEAYEDYLASLTAAYYNWYSAFENLKVGKASYRANTKLMKNILERQRQNIALPIDVNKMKLLLVAKKENVISLQETYDNYTNLIYRAIRHDSPVALVPVKPEQPATEVQFDQAYQQFVQTSRTYKVLDLLEKQTGLEVKKAADDLLPSTNLLLGARLDGNDWGISQTERSLFAGIQVELPFGRKVDKAKHELAKIEHQKTELSNKNKYTELRTNLKNIHLQIERENKLIATANDKVRLAKAILKDEAVNYSYGRVTLNDYIDAVNLVDNNQFNYIDHIVKRNKLMVEWLRLTDKLVGENILTSPPVN